MSGEMSVRTAMAKWASIGLHVFPYVATAKVPFAGTHGHLDATDDPVAAIELYDRIVGNPPRQHAGVGVATGASGILTIDADTVSAGAEFRARVGDAALETLTLITRRGHQFVYSVPSGVMLPNGITKLQGIPGLDSRSGSSWAAFPPSPVKTLDGHYRFHRQNLADAMAEFWQLIIPAPDAVLDLILGHGGSDDADGEGNTSRKGTLRQLIDDDGVLRIPKGSRNAGLHALSGYFRHAGMSAASIRGALEAVNANDVEEPLPAAELDSITKSIATKEPGSLPYAEPWPDPVPIEAARERPAFPIDVLPGWLGEWVAAEAEATQTPADMAGVMSLAAIATTVQRAIDIDVGGWTEPLSLWTLAIMESGSRKSQVMADVFAPIIAAESMLRDEFAPAEHERNGDASTYAAAVKKLQAAEAKAIEDGDAAGISKAREKRMEAEQRLRDLESERRPIPRLLVEDVTPERYLRLMQEQRGAITIQSDEGEVFKTFAGIYRKGGEPTLAPLLKSHAGSPVRVDRQTGEPIIIDRPRGSIAVALQEEALRMIGAIPGAHGLGLIARCVAVFPPDLIGTRATSAPSVPAPAASAYSEKVQALASFGYRAEGFYILRADEQARRVFDEFRGPDHHEGRLIGDLARIRAWGSKMPGLVARISGLLHMAEHGGEGVRLPVSRVTVERAIRFAEDYLIPHAFVLHEITEERPERRAARDILAWIIRDEITEMTSRDATRAVRWLETRNETRDAGLALLVDPHGVLRGPEKKTGTREIRWFVNPKVHESPGMTDKADKAGEAAPWLSGLSGLSGVPISPSED